MTGDSSNDLQEDIIAQFPELELNLPDEELGRLTTMWKTEGKQLEGKVKSSWEENIDLWKGIRVLSGGGIDQVRKNALKENRTFTGLETFLPILTRQNPEAIVEDQEMKENEMSATVATELKYIADTQRLKLKIKQVARNWTFYQLGILKIEWNAIEGITKLIPKVAKRFYFDKDGYIEESQYKGRYLGEQCSMTAREFVELYPKSKAKVEEKTQGNLDSIIVYIEWWTPEYLIIEFENTFPYKIKHPHFNYAKKDKTFDEYGVEMETEDKPKNHFLKPEYPYAFLHVYESEASVYDETGLLQQAKKNQYALDDRVEQVDKNVSRMNNSTVAYGLDEQQVVSANKALTDGGLVAFDDKTTQGIERVSPPGLPGDVYNEMQLQRDAIDQVFATNAVTRGEDSRDQTVRGKIIARQSDESRIGFISEYVEQMVDYAYNYCVQMMYVYYERPWVEQLPETPFLVSIKEGSMIPRDPLTVRNEAIDLFNSGALDIETLYERLDFENPRENAIKTMLYNRDPQAYLALLGYSAVQQPMPPQEAMPAVDMPVAPQELPTDTIPLQV